MISSLYAYKLKNMLVEQCMKSSGKSIYNYIPKFAKLIGETVDVSKRPDGEKEDFLESLSQKEEAKKGWRPSLEGGLRGTCRSRQGDYERGH